MTINEAFYIYKSIKLELEGKDIQPTNNFYNIKQGTKIKILQKLINEKIDLNKFFIANISLSKDFYLEFLSTEKGYNLAMSKYRNFDEVLNKKRNLFFKEIIIECKKMKYIDYEDRDRFIKLTKELNYKLFALIYPEDKELLLSLDDKEYIKKIIRMNMILRNMKNYSKIKKEILKYLTNKKL